MNDSPTDDFSMDESLKRQLVHEARKLWDAGHAFEVGQLLYEHIPVKYRATWAAGVLKVTRNHFPPSSDIEAVLEFAQNPAQWRKGIEDNWREAHSIVATVNRFPYVLPRPFRQMIFTLATNVGKVTYNAQGYPAPFDHDAGWEIADNVKQIVQGVNDPEFEEIVWSTLCCEKYIELEAPVMCHPACPVCQLRDADERKTRQNPQHALPK